VNKGGELIHSAASISSIIALLLKKRELDISSYIQDLLWDYECVIVPGLGGILATYRPADMVLAEQVIYPPTKALAFNEYLKQNDGLLINYICQRSNITYTQATQQVEQWVAQIQQLLQRNEEIYLPNIGKLSKDVERNLRFTPYTSANYLYASYGLPKVAAVPILRREFVPEAAELPAITHTTPSIPRANSRWAMAAIVLLFLSLCTILNMLYQPINIKVLNLNSASVLGFIERWDKQPEVAIEPKVSTSDRLPTIAVPPLNSTVVVPVSRDTTAAISPIDNNTTATIEPIVNTPEPAKAEIPATGRKFYIMIGAYQKPENLQNAELQLQSRFPDAARYEDTSPAMVRIGFYAADNYTQALAKLKEARNDDPTYWLLVK
jgi:cell division septation protein DedD